MSKTLLFRLFGIGSIPEKIRPVLESETIIVSDEGMRGWIITKDLRGPGKRYIRRAEGFSGCLVITNRRVISFTYWKRQINISTDDPKLKKLHVNIPEGGTLSILFDSSSFNDSWAGVIEFRFWTDKALQFYEVFRSIGASPGNPQEDN